MPANKKQVEAWNRTDRKPSIHTGLRYPEEQDWVATVDGLWMDEALYFSGSPRTRRNRNLITNPEVSIHLESGMDVVILHGQAHEQPPLDHGLATRLADTHAAKYGYGFKPENFISGGPGLYIFRPRAAFAWTRFPKDATRWDFQV